MFDINTEMTRPINWNSDTGPLLKSHNKEDTLAVNHDTWRGGGRGDGFAGDLDLFGGGCSRDAREKGSGDGRGWPYCLRFSEFIMRQYNFGAAY